MPSTGTENGRSNGTESVRPSVAVAAAVVRAAAWLSPARERDAFRRQWIGEIDFAAHHTQQSGRLLVRRAWLAWRDALVLRWRRSRGDGPGPRRAPDERRPRLLEGILQDLRLGARSLARSPGFAAVAILTMALGIGATTTIFTIVNGVLLQPLPYPDPEELVIVWPEMRVSDHHLSGIAPSLNSYAAFAGYAADWQYTWTTDEGTERLHGPNATAGFFDVLGLPMVLGRGFREGDDAIDSTSVVLFEQFWRERMGSSPDIIGSTLRIDGRERVVIGVADPALSVFHPDADIVLPRILDSDSSNYYSQDLKLIGRLRSEVGATAALEELRTYVNDEFRPRFGLPAIFSDHVTIDSLQEYLVGGRRSMLLMLFGAVSLTLLIAAANVANLLLSRALARQHEMAIRAALGARGSRLARQVLTETTLLALLGAIPGAMLAWFGLRAAILLLPADIPRIATATLDGTALSFSIGVALVTGWAVGIAPALRAMQADVRLGGARGASESGRNQRLRRLIVLSEIALVVTLVASAGLLAKSFVRISRVDPGFEPDGLVTFQIDPSADAFASGLEARRYYDRLQQRLDTLAGVVESTSVWQMAFTVDGAINSVWRSDEPPAEDTQPPNARWRPVAANFFRTAELRLLRGRGFDEADAEGEPVTVLSRAAAETLFGTQNPLGEQVTISIEGGARLRVVGVVDNVRVAGLDRPGPPILYRPYAQLDERMTNYGLYSRWFVLRIEGPSAPGMAGLVREAVNASDAEVVFLDYRTMPTAIGNSLATRRAMMMMLALFALSAVALGAIGIYGVVAYAVRQRRREISIRMALGATHKRIVRNVMIDTVKIALAGVALGLVLTVGAARTIEQFLFDVNMFDPTVLGLAAGSAVLIALAAAVLPAWRAAQSDPAATLTRD